MSCFVYAGVCLVTQLCLTLCDPRDCSLPGSSVHGNLQARTLEWVACPPPGDLPDPGIEPGSPALQMGSLPSEPPGKPKPTVTTWHFHKESFPAAMSSWRNKKFSTWCPLKVTKLGSQIRGTTASWQVGKAIIRQILVRCLSKEIPNYWTQFILGN